MWYLIIGPADSGKTTLICNLYNYLHYLSLKEPDSVEVLGEVVELDLADLERASRGELEKYPLSQYCLRHRLERQRTPINMCYRASLMFKYGRRKYVLNMLDFSGGLLDAEQRSREVEELRSRFTRVLLSLSEEKFKLLLIIPLDTYYSEELAVKTSASINQLLTHRKLVENGFWRNIKELYVVATKLDILWKNWKYNSPPPTPLNIEFYMRSREALNELLSRIKGFAREYAGVKQVPILAIGFEEEDGRVKQLIDQRFGDLHIPLLYGYGYLLLALTMGYNRLEEIIRGMELFRGRL